MEFRTADSAPDPKEYKLKSISLKNYERIKDITPQNILYLLYFLYGPSKFSYKLDHNNFAYLFRTKSENIYGILYDYKGKISCGMYYPSTLEQNETKFSDAIEHTARILTDFIDHVVIKPVKIGDFKYFAKSGRFNYEGKDMFEELGFDKL